MGRLEARITVLKGVGEARAKLLERLGIYTVGDALGCFPRGFSDRTQIKRISETALYEEAVVAGVVLNEPRLSRIRKGLSLFKFRMGDESGAVDVTYFNADFLRGMLAKGDEIVLFGRVEGDMLRRTMANPELWRGVEENYRGGLYPIYRLTGGLSQKVMRSVMERAVEYGVSEVEDPLPEPFRQRYRLEEKEAALRGIHFPHDREELERARRRLIFEELLTLFLGMRLLGRRARTERREALAAPVDMEAFYRSLPFALTAGQRAAIDEALSDMRSEVPMNRLLQGDVGCGKTVVAAALVYFAVKNGVQAALMAPTELLAAQHYEGLRPLLDRFGIRTVLLTGKGGSKERREKRTLIREGEADFVIGTHALIEEEVSFAKLGLIVADEQHRFGVAQRAALSQKGEHPHLLLMSATPIPRTLALMIYGDLAISSIRELPAGRIPVATTLIPESREEKLFGFLKTELRKGRQAFVVCPAIEEGEEGNALHTVEELTPYLRKKLPGISILPVHGRMKKEEKEAAMAGFAAGEVQILVATTVIEVGINVPNATVMVVENAERFGLSQLHQLRGRVGRGSERSYCVLVSGTRAEKSLERLRVICGTNDGFRIAEADLALRGPGNFFGNEQHGLPDLRIADLLTDTATIGEVERAAEELLDGGGLEAYPALSREVEKLFARTGGYLS